VSIDLNIVKPDRSAHVSNVGSEPWFPDRPILLSEGNKPEHGEPTLYAEWDVQVEVDHNYWLSVAYASKVARQVTVRLFDPRAGKWEDPGWTQAFAKATGGWYEDQIEKYEDTSNVHRLRPNLNYRLRLERLGAFPHIAAVSLVRSANLVFFPPE
jgi:hypothetical protein